MILLRFFHPTGAVFHSRNFLSRIPSDMIPKIICVQVRYNVLLQYVTAVPSAPTLLPQTLISRSGTLKKKEWKIILALIRQNLIPPQTSPCDNFPPRLLTQQGNTKKPEPHLIASETGILRECLLMLSLTAPSPCRSVLENMVVVS